MVAVMEQRQQADDLYDRIGAFLGEQGLSIDPAHYAFAHDILANPDGDVASAVARLTDGGVRLSQREIESLGGRVVAGASLRRGEAEQAAKLVAETQAHVDDFTTMVREMQNETRSFGRDLAAGAAAIEHVPAAQSQIDGIDEIARVTGAMLTRIRDAEARLAQATSEAEALRAKLFEANDSARRDTLTGLPNRRAFDEIFAERRGAGEPCCLALCDIDRFKRINDQHGHAVGDRVLSAVARTLADECAPHLVVRHGGEEFAILLSGLNLADAAEELDRVRALLSAKRFRTRDTDLALGQITVSIGVTAVHAGESSAEPFARADRLLYAAKAEGRDRVHAT